jgi:hypothetical protein
VESAAQPAEATFGATNTRAFAEDRALAVDSGLKTGPLPGVEQFQISAPCKNRFSLAYNAVSPSSDG